MCRLSACFLLAPACAYLYGCCSLSATFGRGVAVRYSLRCALRCWCTRCIVWCTRCSESHPDACFNLGQLLFDGHAAAGTGSMAQSTLPGISLKWKYAEVGVGSGLAGVFRRHLELGFRPLSALRDWADGRISDPPEPVAPATFCNSNTNDVATAPRALQASSGTYRVRFTGSCG